MTTVAALKEITIIARKPALTIFMVPPIENEYGDLVFLLGGFQYYITMIETAKNESMVGCNFAINGVIT